MDKVVLLVERQLLRKKLKEIRDIIEHDIAAEEAIKDIKAVLADLILDD